VVRAAAGDCLVHAPKGETLLPRGAVVDVVVWGRPR
jgi:hypothetical protein